MGDREELLEALMDVLGAAGCPVRKPRYFKMKRAGK
jgi:hypothetical protein